MKTTHEVVISPDLKIVRRENGTIHLAFVEHNEMWGKAWTSSPLPITTAVGCQALGRALIELGEKMR